MNAAFFTFFKPKNVRFENARSGYSDKNFVLNSGSVFWFTALYFLGFAVFKIVMKIFSKLRDSK